MALLRVTTLTLLGLIACKPGEERDSPRARLALDLSVAARDLAAELPLDAIRVLADRARGEVSAADVEDVEGSAAFRTVVMRLDEARQTILVEHAYVVAATTAPDQARFLADADVLGPRAEDALRFGSDYDVTEIPRLRRALETCTPQIEPPVDLPGEDAISIDVYHPIGPASPGACLAVLGLSGVLRGGSAAP